MTSDAKNLRRTVEENKNKIKFCLKLILHVQHAFTVHIEDAVG
jgi:hypothetical protein